MSAMQKTSPNGNGKVRVNLVIVGPLNELLLRVMETERRKGRRLNRHKLFKASLIEYAKRRCIPIPRGL